MSQSDFSFNQRLFFDAVRDVLGEDGVLALRRHVLGAEIYVPGNRVSEGSILAKALGHEAASRIIDKLRVIGADGKAAAGFRVYVGQGPYTLYNQARAAVLDALQQGLTRQEAAVNVGVSQRMVYNIIVAHRKATGLHLELSARKSGAEMDAELIRAHEEEPTLLAMAARLGISPATLHSRLRHARIRTGLEFKLRRPHSLSRSRKIYCQAQPAPARPPRPKAQPAPARPPRPKAQPAPAKPSRPKASSRAERNAELMAAYAEGLTTDAIARRFGWTTSYVYCRFWFLRQETGLQLHFDRAPGHEKVWGEHIRARQAQVEAAFHEGLSSQQIADRLAVSVSTVKNYMNKLRRETGARLSFDMPRQHPHTRMGQDRRRIIAEAYSPGLTLDAIAARTGLTERTVQGHLVRLRRETGHDFVLRRRSTVLEMRPAP